MLRCNKSTFAGCGETSGDCDHVIVVQSRPVHLDVIEVIGIWEGAKCQQGGRDQRYCAVLWRVWKALWTLARKRTRNPGSGPYVLRHGCSNT